MQYETMHGRTGAAVERYRRRQRGLATRRQLLDAGIPGGTVSKRSRPGGPWQRILPHVFLLRTGAPDPVQRLLAAVLFAADQRETCDPLSGGSALLTGRAALRLLRLGSGSQLETPLRTDPVHVLIDERRRVTDAGYVRIIRTRRWPSPLRVEGVPCARAARAAADAASRWDGPPEDLRAMLAMVVRRGRCAPGQLLGELADARLGRNPAVAGAITELTEGVRSLPEGLAREMIRAAGFPEPVWGRDLRTADGEFIARPHAYWPEAGVALEADLPEYHSPHDDRETVRARRLRMRDHGLRVVTVTPRTLAEDPAPFVRALTAALHDGHWAGPPTGVRVW